MKIVEGFFFFFHVFHLIDLQRDAGTRFGCPESSQMGDGGKHIQQLHHILHYTVI